MGKYLASFKNNIQSDLSFRFNLFGNMVGECFGFAIVAYVWFSIYRQGGQIGGYSFSDLLSYYFLSYSISLIVITFEVARLMNESISSGQIINYILKPINHFWLTFVMVIAKVCTNIIFYFSPLLLLFFIIKINLSLSLINFILIFPALILAIFIRFSISYIVGTFTFFWDNIQGLDLMAQSIGKLFSGAIVPIVLLPGVLFKIANVLPFKYTTFFPISLVQGKYTIREALSGLAFSFAWAIGLYVVSRLFFKWGMRKYEAYGN